MTDFNNSTTPPAPHAPGASTAAPPARSGMSRGRGLAVGIGIAGAVIISATVGSAAFAAVAAPGGTSAFSDAVSVAGVTDVSIEMNIGALSVRFADVSEASLDVTSNGGPSADGWRIEVNEDELHIAQDRSWRSGWPWFQFRGGDVRAEVVLPRALEGKLDGTVTVNAGRADVTGDFADLDLAVNAGELIYEGVSTDLTADVKAGSADVRVRDARQLDLSISAGDLTADVTGTAPRETSVSVTAGNAEVRLPQGSYNVSRDRTLGDVTVDLDTSSSSQNAVDVTVAAGDLTIGYGR